MIVQFVCRGNAFRSIIAEAYMKSLRLPGVNILSSGTRASFYKESNAENFPKTLDLLRKHGINQYAKDHYAEDLNQELLDGADVVIFLNKIAYDEAAELFNLPEKIYIWDVTDLGEPGRVPEDEQQREAFSEDVYMEIVENVDSLVNSDEMQRRQ